MSRLFRLWALLCCLMAPTGAAAQIGGPNAAPSDDAILNLSVAVILDRDGNRHDLLNELVARGNRDIIPTLVLMMRITGEHVHVAEALSEMTGTVINTWREAMLWQEAHPEIVPHPSYAELKLRFWSSIDERFLLFFNDPSDRDELRIRFEEITWGGVRVDGIPSLDNPEMIAADAADYMQDSDLVFGVEINGDVRAYPLRIMCWHEMFNDVIGGVPVALAYCTLCGAGILFETDVAGQDQTFVFGSSGFLYRSNKLMFDRQTRSLWNQFTGEPVGGPLAHSGIRLKIRPVTITSWADWRARHPESRVLSLETGHIRDYDSGVVYRDYFASPDLMFPTLVDQTRLGQKDYVYGIRVAGGAKAWPLAAFEGGRVVNDQVGFSNVVLIGDAATWTVRAYDRGDRVFSGDGQTVTDPVGAWQITEDALVGPSGERLPRVPGHIAYWFAWDGYLGAESALFDG
ncbi:MAG: DUF3179 domain-containing protein [Pseudomonadota bacterium]